MLAINHDSDPIAKFDIDITYVYIYESCHIAITCSLKVISIY